MNDQGIVFSEKGQKKIQDRIESLRVDMGASAALLLDHSGHMLIECGRSGNFNINIFLTLLANAMSALNAVVHLLGDETAFDLHSHEGSDYDMYSARINDQVFLCLILEKHSGSGRVGMIWLAMRRAVTELRSMIASATVSSGTAESEQIKTAVSDVLGEAMGMLDSELFASIKPTAELPKPTPSPKPIEPPPPPPVVPSEPQTMLRRRRGIPLEPKPEMRETPAPEPKSEVRETPPTPPKPAEPTPVVDKPRVSPELVQDLKKVMTYEEARALGLINLDNLEAD